MNNEENDFYVEGFKKIDQNLILRDPPKIKWGKQYQEKTNEEKIRYLEKLASAMNHAAYLIQIERDKLNELLFLKESQLITMNDIVIKNNAMLQSEVTKMNGNKQEYNKKIAELNKHIRELEA